MPAEPGCLGRRVWKPPYCSKPTGNRRSTRSGSSPWIRRWPSPGLRRGTASTGRPIQARIDAQLSNAERVALADVVIDNGGSENELLSKLDAEWQRVRRASLEAAS